MVIFWPKDIKPDHTPRPQFNTSTIWHRPSMRFVGIKPPKVVDGSVPGPIDA